MAVFDDELVDNVTDRGTQPLSTTIESPSIKDINKSTGGFSTYGNESINETGLSIDDLSKLSLSNQSTVNSPFQSISKAELLANKRYPLYERSKNLENIYGLQQSWSDRLANSTVKFAGTTLGTFLQGFATIPNTIEAIKQGEIDALSGAPDGYEASIDNWLKNLEDNFPNYYSNYEKAHPFRAIIPFTTGSANFWGDKVIKNLGFTAGAIANAIVTDLAIGAVTGGLGEIPLVSSQIGKFSLYLNKIFAGTNKLDEALNVATSLGKTQEQIMNLKKLGEVAQVIKLTSGPRYAMSIYGSARTEAAIEARDSYNKIREELIFQHKLKNTGVEPVGTELDKINAYAEDAMNTRFGINMALLTVSNAVQFGNLFKSFNKTNKSLSESLNKINLKEGSLDTFEKVPTNAIWESVKPSLKNVFTEGVYEEGGQFATERGVYDYYTRKYRSPKNKELWDSIDETISSTLKGLKDQFGSTEGIENMIVGGITAMIAGGIANKIQPVKGGDENSKLQASLNILNLHGLTGTLAQQYTDTVNTAAIAKEMDEAIAKKDAYTYKNLKSDMFFNFVYSRVPYNLHDVTLEQLNMLKDLPKEEFERTFGMDFTESAITTVAGYVDTLIDEANHIKKVADSIDLTFKNPFKLFVNPQTEEEAQQSVKFNTFNDWKKNLVYYGVTDKVANARLEGIQNDLSSISPMLTNELVATLTSVESLKDLSKQYEERAIQLNKTITEYTSPKDKKVTKDAIKTLRTLSEKINRSQKDVEIKLFNDLLNFELNLQDPKKEKVIGTERSSEIFNHGVDINRLESRKKKASEIFDYLSSEEGFNKFFSQEEKIPVPKEAVEVAKEATKIPSIVNKAGIEEPIRIGREYEIENVKEAKIKKLADDRWEVTSPEGESSFFSNEEDAKIEQKNINEDFSALKKVKILDINPDNTLKVEDKNGNIYNLSPDKLVGYDVIITEQEKLLKFKEDLDKDQNDIIHSSGNVSTNSLDQDLQSEDPEPKKKATDILFVSTTSVSEDWEAGTLKPHHIKAMAFLNNVKNFAGREKVKLILVTQNQEKSLGLEGLTALSMEGTGQTPDKYTDVNEGLVAAVYVYQEKDGLYFIDENGELQTKVGEKVDLNKVVFSTMPTTHLVWGDGKTPRYREGERENASAEAKRWEIKRKQLFALPEGQYETYSFLISRGIPNILDPLDTNHVGDTLVSEDVIKSHEGLIVIPTTDTIFHQGQLLKFPNGRPVLQYQDTLQFLKNGKFNKNQVETIYQTIKALSEDAVRQSKLGAKITLNRRYTKFLQNVLFYNDLKKSKTPSKNQFFIDTNSMDVLFGDKRWDITKIAELEQEIKDKLSETFSSVNNYTLTKLFSEPFNELYYEDNELKERKWVNYQTYLLSSSYPDGTKRSVTDTPLTTSVAEVTDAVPYNYKQKYAILQGIELPGPTPQPKKKEVNIKFTIGNYVIDGTTENTYSLKNGPVQFIASRDKDGDIEVSVKSNETIKKIANNPSTMDVVISALKVAKLFDATKNNEELALDFVSSKIAGDLKLKISEVNTVPKPELPVLGFLTLTELQNLPSSDEMLRVKKAQSEIEENYKILEQLKDCLWQ